MRCGDFAGVGKCFEDLSNQADIGRCDRNAAGQRFEQMARSGFEMRAAHGQITGPVQVRKGGAADRRLKSDPAGQVERVRLPAQVRFIAPLAHQ